MLYWSLSLLLLASALPNDVLGTNHKLHEVMSHSQHSLFFSEEKGPEYDLVTPTSRDASGDYLSHQLQMTSDILSERRQRRSADNHDEDSTFLHMAAFGEDHQLALKRNRHMFHPHFSVNIHDHDGEMRTLPYDTDCFHHGHIKGHDDSEIAMSNCEGKLMGTIRRKREIYHVHPLPSELRDHETHNPEGHTHIIHRVREKKEGEAGHSANDETIRKRRKRQVDLPPVSSINFCPEDGKIKPPMSEPQELEEAMFVDMADTLVLNEFQSRTASIREFGNNYVHAAMFLDHTMYEKYNGDEGFLVLYHLTMFNIINLIYQPSKTQYHVFIVLINLRVFQRPQPNLHITQDSSRLLDNFCSFQQHLNPAIGHPLRWNHAFLMTGYGLCFRSNQDCGELGRAPIEGVCIPDRECSVNREGGLNTAFVLAHELGHNLGMFHDGHPSEAGNCPASDGYLMKSSTGDAARLWEFSSCSKSHLRRYLRNSFSACMDKGVAGPTRQTDLTNQLRHSCSKPPGQLYSRDEQCRLQWRHQKSQYFPGHGFKFCSRTTYGVRDICKHLYCDNGHRDQGCYSTFTPAMDGTRCGTNKVCWRYQCVPAQRMYTESNYCAPEVPGPRDVVDVSSDLPDLPIPTRPSPTTTPPPPLPIDGSWSFFSAFSRCSRTCGGGVRFRERLCNSPPPRFGGRDCQGSNRMFEICNTQTCPNGQTYRESQCQRLGSSWHESVTRPSEEPCSLWCEERNLDRSVIRRHYTSPAVEEGARCNVAASSNDRCIRDRCTTVGCDNIINSTARLDECGVCGGTSDTCRAWSGSYYDHWLNFGFHPAKLRGSGYSIPKGSWDISFNFTEVTPACLMVLRNTNNTNRVYFLHGPGTAIRTGGFGFLVGNTIGQYYNYNGQKQRLVISQKTDTPLILEVLYFPERGEPVAIDFRWKSKLIPKSSRFEWVTTRPYGPCSVTCGRGVERKVVRCHNKFSGSLVKDATCVRNGFPKPVEERECARAPCGTVAVLRQEALPEELCTCAGQNQNWVCIANSTIGEVEVLHPRLCNRTERMSTLKICPQVVCEPRLQYCRGDSSPLCTFYTGKSCPADIRSLCPETCKACELMTETQANLSSGCYKFVRGLDRSAHGYPLIPGVPAYTQLLQIQGVSLSPNINVQLELSTCHGMGMLFYWSAEDGSILTVQLNNGLVEFKIVSGGTELVSIVHPTPVCLGEFYNIDIFLSAIEQRLTVGIVNEENTAELRQEQIASPLTMRDTAYVGYADPSASDIGSVVSFNGCIRSIQVGTESFSPLTSCNSRAENVNTNTCHVLPRILRETQANLSSGCYKFVRGLDRSAHGYPLIPGVPAYTQLLQIQGVSLSPNINVQLELSTCHGMGMLFYWSAEDGSILTVQLNNGLVEFKIVSGGTELVSIVHPTPVCLGEFYNIDIFLSAIEQRLTVGIVNEENTAELRQEQIASPLTMRDTAYVGYADPSASDIGSVVSFNGCIRSIQVGTESFSPLTSCNSRAENVNTNTCHVLPRILRETQANLSSGCYKFVRGLDRSAHGYPLIPGVPAYTQLLQIQGVSLSPNINVQLELSTRHGMGMLFYWSAEDGSILTVQLNNCLVEFKIVSGGTELVSIVHPTPVCLGEFYNIDIFLSAIEQRLTVGIVNEENTAELRQEQIASPLTMRDTAYVGYVDPSASDIGSVVSFNGCIRSIQVGTESFSPLTSCNSRAENVNTNTCHVLPRP